LKHACYGYWDDHKGTFKLPKSYINFAKILEHTIFRLSYAGKMRGRWK